MTSESRIDRLERHLGLQNATPRSAVVVYDHCDAPQDPDELDSWLRSKCPPNVSAVFFIPDNGRGTALGSDSFVSPDQRA